MTGPLPQAGGATPGNELESWLIATYGSTGRLRPEWSKAWAYSENGPWTNSSTIDAIRQSFQGQNDFSDVASTLAQYDHAGLFRSPLLDKLFQL